MDDIIFLIIAVAISIFAAINKSKKKQMAGQAIQPGRQELENNRRNRFMDQLLGEDFLDDEEQAPQVPVRVKPPVEKVAFTSSIDAGKAMYYQLPRFKSTLPDRPKHTSISSNKKIREDQPSIEEPEESISYLEDFSLRKAVVFSLILERKS